MADTITITVDDADVLAALGRLQAASADLSPLFGVLGEGLKDSTQKRFDAGAGPDGTPWVALSAAYAARKKPNTGKILVLHGFLADTIAYNYDSSGVEVGSNLVYAAIHQFGGNAGRGGAARIPARPFLGLSDEDKDMVIFRADRYLEEAISG